MKIIITDNDCSYSGKLAHELRAYWGSRGIAVAALDFFAPCLEMATASIYLGERYGVGKVPETTSSLARAIYTWGRAKKDAGLWARAAESQIEIFIKEWRRKDLPHRVVVYNVPHMERDSESLFNSGYFKKSDLIFGPEDSPTAENIIKSYNQHIESRLNG